MDHSNKQEHMAYKTTVQWSIWHFSAFIGSFSCWSNSQRLIHVGLKLCLHLDVNGNSDETFLRAHTAPTHCRQSSVFLWIWCQTLELEAEAAVSTERRWLSSLCRRGTSDSRRLEWSSLCTASSSTLSPGRICRTWRKSKSLLCHKQPEWGRVICNINEKNIFYKIVMINYMSELTCPLEMSSRSLILQPL